MRCVLAAALVALTRAACAQEGPEDWSLHGQATWITQKKPAFDAAYSGAHSLSPDAEHGYSFTTTLFAGARVWRGGEAYVNLEAIQGQPFSNQAGLGGFPNAELQKAAGTDVSWYRARVFLRQTFGFGGGEEAIEADANQLRQAADRRRLVITAGQVAVGDLFDDNRYSHDPRTDFQNGALSSSGAYDYASDSRGYTWGVAAEWHDGDWALRAARFLQPKEPNGLELDTAIGTHYGDQVEFEHALAFGGRAGRVRVLVFHNVAVMGRFRDALELAARTGQPPDVSLVRRRNEKWGVAANLEHEVADDVGVFARASWNPGATEVYAFAEIDRSAALGTVIGGGRWGRKDDQLGLAFVANGLSAAHRDYLAAGGLGFFLGDGRLNYGPEQALEARYGVALGKHFVAGADYQRIQHPGYNRDRGPASFYGFRLHAEF
jgi:high affinity Mn2+ porin